MKIQVKHEKLLKAKSDAIILHFYEEDGVLANSMKAYGQPYSSIVSPVLRTGDFEGKLYQTNIIYTQHKIDATRVLLLGLGKRNELTRDKLRGSYARAAQILRSLNLKAFSTSFEQSLFDLPINEVAEAAIEGVQLGLYQFSTFKTVDVDKIHSIDEFTIFEEDSAVFDIIRKAAKNAAVICDAVCFARDLVSMPANEMTPTDLAREASQIASRHKSLSCRILDRAEMKKLGMNALLGVASGSDQPPKFIILEYNGAKKTDAKIVLVGKGLTFDSGGISIKPAEKMDEMKTDMAGAAAVLGAIRAASDLKLQINVVGLIPATENLPSGKAYKPGDILKSMSGKTIEVLNTDAEGRLILADALAYAGRYKPAAVIDIATLTGACIVALGEQVIGMMGTDESLKDKVRQSADSTGEKVWELPLWEEYHELVKSDVADYKNSAGRPGGTITAAAFLSKFVGDYPWVHLDIAGPAWSAKDRPYVPKGASGIGVRLFTDLLRHWGDKKE